VKTLLHKYSIIVSIVFNMSIQKKSLTLAKLPEDIIFEISTNLDQKHKSLWFTCSELYGISKKHRKIVLSIKGTREFIKNCKIRRQINGLMKTPLRQLCVTLPKGRIQNVDIFANAFRVDLFYCAKIVNVSSLYRVNTLNLQGCVNIRDVSALTNVRVLNLSYCYVTDVSMLTNVHTLNLSHSFVVDVSSLGNVHYLDLSRTNVVDVSALKNVHTLNLSDCYSLSDVSSLTNVKNLNLDRCHRITDVSALGNTKVLSLKSLREIDDITALKNVDTLVLNDCCKIFDVSCLTNVRRLSISCYNYNTMTHRVYDASMLENVEIFNNFSTLVSGVFYKDAIKKLKNKQSR